MIGSLHGAIAPDRITMAIPTSGERLGDERFKQDYNLKYAYVSGGMYKGIASKELVVKMGKAGMLGFYGTGGLALEEIESGIRFIQEKLPNGEPFGMNFVHYSGNPKLEMEVIRVFLRLGIRTVEAAAFMNVTPALVLYRAKGLSESAENPRGPRNRIIAKISRPEIAESFLSPAPKGLVEKLVGEGELTAREAELLAGVAMADDLCAEADSGGHTDQAVAYALIPSISRMRDRCMARFGYKYPIRLGAAGGIGTPEAAAAAFILGADFILTGSINQCTVEAGTSDSVKDLLQEINVQDTDYAPAGDMFEIGAKVQVLKRGVFFPARANRLHELYRRHDSLDGIDEKSKRQVEGIYFKKTFAEVYEEVKTHFRRKAPEEIEMAERNPKHKMALVFKWYYAQTTRFALEGRIEERVNYQVHCGPALGAFNQWVKGTEWESWRRRRVDEIGLKLMNEAADHLANKLTGIFRDH